MQIPDRARGSFDTGEGSGDVDVWEEHVEALELFRRLRRAWRLAPQGGVIGMDYAQMQYVMTMRGVAQESWPRLLDEIEVMAEAALQLLDEKRQK